MHPLARFLRIEAAAGGVLLLCAVVALLLANSPWATGYRSLWETSIGLQWGTYTYSHSLRHWINDGAMTLFFFVVALELKRELVLGELRKPRMLGLPVAAALGGMLVPALLFLLVVDPGGGAQRGWGIVMATDTAFVIGSLSVLGSRIPSSLRLFLLSLAIFDDVGAIVVIAIAYGEMLNPAAILSAAAALAGIVLLRWVGIRHVVVYTALGAVVWLALDMSGIHPTLAGVVLGLMTPARSWVSDSRLRAILDRVVILPGGKEASTTREGRQDLRRAHTATREVLSPLERIELALHPWIAFAVVPVFALANTGIELSWDRIDWSLATAVVAGLTLGKPAGVIGFSYLVVRLGLATRPTGLTWPIIAGGALLTGIGFTMSLLIADLALPAGLLASAKLGVLIASVLSASLGIAVLAWLTLRRRPGTAGPRVGTEPY